MKVKEKRLSDQLLLCNTVCGGFSTLYSILLYKTRHALSLPGTSLYYQPGLLFGGTLDHDCNIQRSIGYYLESLICLAPFMKHPLKITLRGVTNDQIDPSVDTLKATAIPLLKRFGIDGEHFELKGKYHVTKRGPALRNPMFTLVTRVLQGDFGIVEDSFNDAEVVPLIVGRWRELGGCHLEEVEKSFFSCPVRKVLRPVHLTDPGKIKRVRGVAYPLNRGLYKKSFLTMLKRPDDERFSLVNWDNLHQKLYSVRVSPQIGNRIVESARSILNKFLPDIYIYTDHLKGANSGKSPGFGLSLVAETTEGYFMSAELASSPQGQGATVLPEDLGKNCAKLLLEEIYRDHQIPFLDVLISKSQGGDRLESTIYRKPTATNSLLRWDSNHPYSLKKGIPKGQYLRLRRNCSSKKNFKIMADDLRQRFRTRGYPDRILREAFQHANKQDRENLLTPRREETEPTK
ncbi:unnamed protein product, partial [Ranitomeya imitator]